MKARMRIIVQAIFVCLAVSNANAEDSFWFNSSGTNSWHTASNWFENDLPGPTDTAWFNLAANGVVTVTSDVTVDSLNLDSNLPGGGFVEVTIDIGSGTKLTATNGTGYGYYTGMATSTGHLTLQGLGMLETSSFVLGNSAALTLQGGVQVETGDLWGTSNNGGGRSWDILGTDTMLSVSTVDIGEYGGDIFSVLGGAEMLTNTVYLREGDFGSTGAEVTISGTDSRWVNSGDFQVGGGNTSSGSANVYVNNGGFLQSQNITLGELGGSPNNGQLVVGTNGQVVATLLTVTANGTARLEGGTIAADSFTNSNGGIFNFDDGSLIIDGGAFVHGGTDYTLEGANATSQALLTLQNGASWNVGGSLDVGENFKGQLNVNSSSTVVATDISVLNDGELTLDGGTLTTGSFGNVSWRQFQSLN